jgi:hypothetical protein
MNETDELPKNVKALKPTGEPANYKVNNFCPLGKNCCQVTRKTSVKSWKADVEKDFVPQSNPPAPRKARLKEKK